VLFPILVGLIVPSLLIGVLGGGKVLQVMTAGAFPELFPHTAKSLAGGLPVWLGSGIICGVVLVYVFGGGLRSTAWANALQTCIFMVLGVVTFFVIAHRLGGAAAASQSTADVRPDLIHRGEHIGYLRYISYAFIPLSVAMFPHLFQHWMTARSAKTFRPTVILHPAFIMIVWVPCVLLGVWGAGMLAGKPIVPPPVAANPNAVLAFMVKTLTNPYLAGFLTVGILAAIMSSLDSQFLCIGSIFTHDVVLHHFGEDRFTDAQRVLIGRLFVLAIVLLTYVLAILARGTSVFALGVWCFSGFASLFPLVFASLYWKRVTRAGAIASVLAAAVVWVLLFQQSGWGEDRRYLFHGMMPVATIFAASTVALVAVSLVTRPPSERTINRYFSE